MADPALGDPADRGRLVVTDRAVRRIAEAAAVEVTGVVRSGSTLDRVLRHDYPRVDTTIAGRRARLSLDVAVAWPHPLARVTAKVRDAVAQRVHDYAGMQVDAVDVTAASVVHVAPNETRRVQ